MASFKKFTLVLHQLLNTNIYDVDSIRIIFLQCIGRNQLEEDNCSESKTFFESLRKMLIARKLISHENEKLSISGAGSFSFVLRIPNKILNISNGRQYSSLKVFKNDRISQVPNEIRVLEHLKQVKNDFMIRLIMNVQLNTHGLAPCQTCFLLLPHYDMSLFDLLEQKANAFVKTKQSVYNARTLQVSVITENIIYIIQQLFSAVQFMHDNGMAHRDIKLDNILVGLDPSTSSVTSVVLTDFGYSCIKSESSKHVSGTSIYIAPELFYAATLRQEVVFTMQALQTADLFSLGQTICIFLTRAMVRGNAKMKDLEFQEFLNSRSNFRRTLRMSQGRHMIDLFVTLSPQSTFTDALHRWMHPDPGQRTLFPFQEREKQTQEEYKIQMIRALKDVSVSENPVFSCEAKFEKLTMENIQIRYDAWKNNGNIEK